MIEPFAYWSFVVASVLLVIVPGPNVLVIVATSTAHGSRHGLQTVFGTSTAMMLQLLIAATGTAWLVDVFSQGLQWLRWIGIAYLLYLGLSQFLRPGIDQLMPEKVMASHFFKRGFIVSLTNPKTILFFSAFLPQFVTAPQSYGFQIAVLSVTFLLLATLLDSAYALLAGRLTHGLQDRRWLSACRPVSAILYWLAALWLILIGRDQA